MSTSPTNADAPVSGGGGDTTSAGPAPQRKRKPALMIGARFYRIVEQFQGRVDRTLQNRQAVQKEATPKSLLVAEDKHIRTHMERLAWTRGTANWTIIGLVVQVALLVLIFVGALAAASRPFGMVIGTPSLRDKVEAHIESNFQPNADAIDLYMQMVLTGLENVDYLGNHWRRRGLLRGVIHPDIISETEGQYRRVEQSIKSSMIIQSLHIDSVQVIGFDEHRVSCYVKGYILVAMLMPPKELSEKPVTVAFRARAVLEPNLPSLQNPERFYMTELKKRIGPQAPKWDDEQVFNR